MTIGRTNSGTGGGGGGISSGKAVIAVTAEVGSTITFQKNGIAVRTLKPDQGIPVADNSSFATWFYSVSDSNYGAWDVRATKNGNSKEKSVSVTENKEYDIWLYYDIYLIKDGKFNTDFTATRYGGSYLEENANGYVVLHSNAATNSYATCQFSPDIDVTDYNYLIFDGRARGYYASGKCPAYGIITSRGYGRSSTSFSVARVLLSSTTNTLTARATTYCGISNQIGEKPIGFQEAGSGQSNAQGDIYCYNLYLSDEVPT